MNNKLLYIFNLIIIKTYKNSKNNQEFCPIQYWNELKNIILKYNIQATKWNNIDKRIYNKIFNEPEYYINGYGNKIINDSNHYLIQHVRIPYHNTPTLDKILQIAFSIGMIRSLTSKTYLQQNYYTKYKLDKITTYLSNYDIKMLSNNIKDELIEELSSYYNIDNCKN